MTLRPRRVVGIGPAIAIGLDDHVELAHPEILQSACLSEHHSAAPRPAVATAPAWLGVCLGARSSHDYYWGTHPPGLLRKAIPKPSASSSGNTNTQKITSGSRSIPSAGRPADASTPTTGRSSAREFLAGKPDSAPGGRLVLSLISASLFPQVPAGEAHEHIFQARLPRGQVFKLRATAVQTSFNNTGIVICGSRTLSDMSPSSLRTASTPGNSFHLSAPCTPSEPPLDGKFDHVMSTEMIDQLRRTSSRDYLTVIDNHQPVTKLLGLIHVMRSQQHRATRLLKVPHDVPKLPPTLRIKSGGRLVQKQNLRISHQRRRHSQPLLLAARQLSHPGIRLSPQVARRRALLPLDAALGRNWQTSQSSRAP